MRASNKFLFFPTIGTFSILGEQTFSYHPFIFPSFPYIISFPSCLCPAAADVPTVKCLRKFSVIQYVLHFSQQTQLDVQWAYSAL